VVPARKLPCFLFKASRWNRSFQFLNELLQSHFL